MDTVVGKFQIELTEEYLNEGWDMSTHTSGKTGEIKTKYMRNADPFKGTYYPIGYGPQAKPLLTLEFSLPKVLYGVNWPMLVDVKLAVAKADEMLAADAGWPDLPSIGEAEIVRLDVCYNHSVGEHLHAYLQALSRLEYRARQTVPFLGTGVEYRCLSGKTKFYDKRAETIAMHHNQPDHWAPPGTLRQETTLRHPRDVAQALRLSRPVKLNDLQPEAALDVMWRDLRHLGIVGCQFATADLALKTLCDAYNDIKGLRLYGALHASQERQKNLVAHETGTLRHSITRLLREIRTAGIAPAIVEGEPLPPLEIKWPPSRDQVPEGYWPAAEKYQY
jgi:hypothetical protein